MLWFDETLRQELMEAALEELEPTLEKLTCWEQERSPRYRRERTRLLTDPWGWAKRRVRPAWKRIARNVACVLLACTVAFGALLAASPTVRAAVSTWLRQITQDGTSTTVTYTSGDPEEGTPALPWRVTWLPEGWTLESVTADDDHGVWRFGVTGDGGLIERGLDFSYAAPGAGVGYWTTLDTNSAAKSRNEVHGRPADYYREENLLIWEETDEALVTVEVLPSDPALLERAAESVMPWEGDPVEYTVGWAPEGHEEVMHSFSGGVGEWVWVRNRTPLNLLYINDPLCPFRVPDRASEAVTVNGLPGRFWPAIFTREEWDAQIVEDPMSPTFVGCDLQACAVLTWEDPETNTSFRISGIGEKEDFLRMAESVTRK